MRMSEREPWWRGTSPTDPVVGPRGWNGFFHTVVNDMDAAQLIELKRLQSDPQPEATDAGPYIVDRRRATRTPATGQRLGVVFGVEGGRWLLPLELRDTSAGGVGLISAQALEAGDRVTLYDEGSRATFIKGRIARCALRDDGRFDLGLSI